MGGNEKHKKDVTENKDQKRTVVNKVKFLEAFKGAAGNITHACDKIGIGRSTFNLWKVSDPEFAIQVDYQDEENLDFAESMLQINIKDRKENSIFFFLNNKGGSRGYSRQVNLDHTTKGDKIQKSTVDLSKLSDAALDEIIALQKDIE